MQAAIFSKNNDLIRLINQTGIMHRFSTETFCDELLLIRALRSKSFSLVIVDAAAQYSRHSLLCQWRASHGCKVPLLVVGTFASSYAMQTALESDAADIVTGPVNPDELSVRAGRVLHRSPYPTQASMVCVGRYALDRRNCRILLDDSAIVLTAREYQLAAVLLANPGVNFSREQLSRIVWSSSRDVAERSLEQYIYKLRKKLRLSAETGVVLRTLYAQGYRIEVAAHEPAPALPAAAATNAAIAASPDAVPVAPTHAHEAPCPIQGPSPQRGLRP